METPAPLEALVLLATPALLETPAPKVQKALKA
jgi:hypothetical protein